MTFLQGELTERFINDFISLSFSLACQIQGLQNASAGIACVFFVGLGIDWIEQICFM